MCFHYFLKTHSLVFFFFIFMTNYSELVVLLQSGIIFLLPSYYQSHSIFLSLVFLLWSWVWFVFYFLLFFLFFFLLFFVIRFSNVFSVYLDCFLCYHAIDLWCTNSPMIIPFDESCRYPCGYADCTDSLLFFDLFIDFNNGCLCLSIFSGICQFSSF